MEAREPRPPSGPRPSPDSDATASSAAAGPTRVAALEAVVGAVLLAGAWLVAADGQVPAAERAVFEVVNGAPAALSTVLWPVMQLGTFLGAVGVAVATLALWRTPRPAVDALLAVLLASWLTQVVKATVERGRPVVELADVVVREAGVDGWGFTSGHSAAAFALAAAVAPRLHPATRVVAYVVAGLVALARVTHGVHLPADVVGGAGLGLVVGGLVVLALDRATRLVTPEPTP